MSRTRALPKSLKSHDRSLRDYDSPRSADEEAEAWRDDTKAHTARKTQRGDLCLVLSDAQTAALGHHES